MSRKVLQFVEIDVTFCALRYGTTNGAGTCPAVLGVDSEAKCFNTLATCPATVLPSFTDDPVTLRFGKDSAYLRESGIDCIPNLLDVAVTPATISLGGGLGARASVRATFKDHRWPDTAPGFDPYYAERDYDPAKQGWFWGKFRARQRYLQGRNFRTYWGLLGQSLEEMEVRHYVIENSDGPGAGGLFTIIAKDPLKLTDRDRAKAPLQSNGFLTAGIDADDASAGLSPSGIGAEYPSSDFYVAIGGSEIVHVSTRSSDTLTIDERGALGTTAAAHESEELVQTVLRYEAEDPADIIADLLTTYAGVPPEWIPLEAWQGETAANLQRVYTATIAQPEGVGDLLTELIEQGPFALWWDERAQLMRFQVLRGIVTNAEVYDAENVIEGSFQIREQPGKRLSRVTVYYGMRNPLEAIDDRKNFRSAVTRVETDAETFYGSAAEKVIYSRWFPAFGRTNGERLAVILLGRFITPPRLFPFSVMRQSGVLEPQAGGGYKVGSPALQDATGAEILVPVQVTKLTPTEAEIRVEAEEVNFVPFVPDDEVTRPITIDTNELNLNVRDIHDDLYPALSSDDVLDGIGVVVTVQAGDIIVGSSSIAEPAMDIGSWPTVAATGNTTSGSPVITNLDVAATDLRVGTHVTGPNIPGGNAGAKILSVDSASQITLDANATATEVGADLTLHFYVKLVVLGRIQGMGGTGGSYQGDHAVEAGDGGPALHTRYPIDLDATGGEIWGGAGGGGVGFTVVFVPIPHGGGGGAGQLPGNGGTAVSNGSPGTTEAGGLGGGGAGGTGGDPGEDGGEGAGGASGGAAGAAIDGVSYVTEIAAGDRRGPEIN